MPLDGEWTGKAEVRLDFTQGRRDAVLTVMRVDEIEHLALTIGKRFGWHSVQVNTFSGDGKSGIGGGIVSAMIDVWM